MTKKETKIKRKKLAVVTLAELVKSGEKSEHENLDLKKETEKKEEDK